MRKVLHGHVSPETAHIVPDYPYGRVLRCKMRWWIETATKGASKGEQRVVQQTTNPKVVGREVWNKPKASTYSYLRLIFIDQENGHTMSDGLGLHAWWDEVMQFKINYEVQLDEDQTKRLGLIEKALRSGTSYKDEWAAFDAGATGGLCLLPNDNAKKAFELGVQFAKS
jgi:hypothetical protein